MKSSRTTVVRQTLVALTISVALTAGPAAASPESEVKGPCKYEDSVSCVWDARHMGNGQGRSFWTDAGGHIHFISHHRAHVLMVRTAK